jgi:DNA-directed RNA polymerase subunit RPC12/RpoP
MSNDNNNSLEVFCTNCDFKGAITLLELMLLEDFECPKCRHKELRKRSRAGRILPGSGE